LEIICFSPRENIATKENLKSLVCSISNHHLHLQSSYSFWSHYAQKHAIGIHVQQLLMRVAMFAKNNPKNIRAFLCRIDICRKESRDIAKIARLTSRKRC